MIAPRLGMMNKVRRIALMIVLQLIAVIRLHGEAEKKQSRITDLFLACDRATSCGDTASALYFAPSAADRPLGGIHARLRKWFLVSSAAGRPRAPGPDACAGGLVGAHRSFVKGQPICWVAAVLCNAGQRFRIPNPQGTRSHGRRSDRRHGGHPCDRSLPPGKCAGGWSQQAPGVGGWRRISPG